MCEGELLPARKLPRAEKSNKIALQYFDSEQSHKANLIQDGRLLMTRFSRQKAITHQRFYFFLALRTATGKTSCRLLRDGNDASGAISEREQEGQGGVEPD